MPEKPANKSAIVGWTPVAPGENAARPDTPVYRGRRTTGESEKHRYRMGFGFPPSPIAFRSVTLFLNRSILSVKIF